MFESALNIIGILVCMAGIIFAAIFAFGLVATLCAVIIRDVRGFIAYNRSK